MKIITIFTVGILTFTLSACLKESSSVQSAEKVEAEKESVTVVTAEEAKKLLATEEAPQVIDVRTAEEFKEGHIEGAKQIDFKGENFREELAKLDPKKSYLFHCRSGSRSTKTLPVWKELGFEKLYHLDTGIQGWEKAKGETVQGE
ncbi:MAG: rhodanese-like domain-containing protein [Roseibacillus sp.]